MNHRIGYGGVGAVVYPLTETSVLKRIWIALQSQGLAVDLGSDADYAQHIVVAKRWRVFGSGSVLPIGSSLIEPRDWVCLRSIGFALSTAGVVV